MRCRLIGGSGPPTARSSEGGQAATYRMAENAFMSDASSGFIIDDDHVLDEDESLVAYLQDALRSNKARMARMKGMFGEEYA